MGNSLSDSVDLLIPFFGNFGFELSDNPGGLNRSMQHWLKVYSPAFQSPRSFAGVD